MVSAAHGLQGSCCHQPEVDFVGFFFFQLEIFSLAYECDTTRCDMTIGMQLQMDE
jgi:hypothetical protein